MTLDSTNSRSARLAPIASAPLLGAQQGRIGKQGTEPNTLLGSEVGTYTKPTPAHTTTDSTPPCWYYLFVHHKKVKAFQQQLKKDNRRFFIHTSIKYIPRRGKDPEKANALKEVTTPTVSGLIFLQGHAKELQRYIDQVFPNYHLCRNCSTGRVAEISNLQMEPFMRLAKALPENVRFLLRPFQYYAQNRTLLRITTGDFAGLEGYVIRIARDRRLVMQVGSMAIAISGIFAERFEEVNKNQTSAQEQATYYKRNLQERNAFIDRYFHPVRTPQEVAEQTTNINLLLTQTLSDLASQHINAAETYEALYFIIEEIGYYYAPLAPHFGSQLAPIFTAGASVRQALQDLLAHPHLTPDIRQRYEAELQALDTSYAYLFVPSGGDASRVGEVIIN